MGVKVHALVAEDLPACLQEEKYLREVGLGLVFEVPRPTWSWRVEKLFFWVAGELLAERGLSTDRFSLVGGTFSGVGSSCTRMDDSRQDAEAWEELARSTKMKRL